MCPVASIRKRRGGFTLVELLLVIGIMALLITLAIPAFNGIGRGTGMQTAVSELRSTLSLARQWAITHNASAYVVFPDEALNYASDPGAIALARRGYRVYTKREGYISDWKLLPPGIFFAIDSADNSKVRDSKTIFLNADVENVPFPNSSSPKQDIIALRFDPTGRNTRATGNDFEIYCSEGFYSSINTNSGTATIGFKAAKQLMSVEVSQLTGQLKVKDYDI